MVGREELQLDEYKAKDILYAGDAPINEASLHALLGGSALAICFRFLDPAKPMSDQPIQKTAFDQYKSYSPTREEIWRQRREEKMRKKEEALEKRARRLSEMQRLARQAIEDEREARRFEKEQRKLDLLKSGSPNLTGVYGVHKIRPAPPGADGVGASAHYFPDSTPKEKPKWQLATDERLLVMISKILEAIEKQTKLIKAVHYFPDSTPKEKPKWQLVRYATVVFLLASVTLGSCSCPRDWMHSYGNCSYAIHCHGDIHGLKLPEECLSSNYPANVTLTLDNPSIFNESDPKIDWSLLSSVVSFRAIGKWPQESLAMVEKMDGLTKLYLSGNQIKHINGSPFYRLFYLEVVDLSYNRLSQIKNLLQMEMQPSKLQKLVLAYNAIENIPDDTFDQVTFLVELDLSNNSISNLNNMTFSQLSQLKVLKLSNNNIFDLDGAINSLKVLRHLYLKGNQIEKIDLQSLQIIYDLDTFDVSANRLEKLFPEWLSRHWRHFGSNSKCKIILSENYITSLPNATSEIKMRRFSRDVVGNKLIDVQLDLSKNSISNIEPYALSYIMHLTSLDLSHNKLITFVVNVDDLKHVKYLNLSKNYIDHLDYESFASMTNLQNLDLSFNRLQNLPDQTFVNNFILRYVNMSNNYFDAIKRLNIKIFHPEGGVLDLSYNGLSSLSMPNGEGLRLMHLSLHANEITDVSLVELSFQKDLKILDLSDNKITELDESSLRLPSNLVTLELSRNEINAVRPSTFKGMGQLLTLRLSYNNLTLIEYGAFDGLTSLENLDLSYNKIEVLRSETIMNLKSLRFLSLRFNGMYNLDYKAWIGHKHALRVNIDGNNFTCEWLATAIRDFSNGYSNMEPTIAVAAAKDPSLKGIPCVHSETNEEEPHLIVQATDERLLVMISKILEAIEKQTKLIKAQLVDKVVIAICMVAQSYSQLPEATLTPFPEVGCKRKSHYSSDYIRECSDPWYCRNVISSLEFDSSEICDLNKKIHSSRHGRKMNPFYIIYKYENENGDNTFDSLYSTIPRFERSYQNPLPFIYSLDLENNDYEFVPRLQEMQNLAILKLSRNILITAKLSNINELPALKYLDYSHNRITNIEVTPGEHEFQALKTLNISHNYLANIPEAIFDSLANLEFLDLSHNYIYALDILSFEGIRKLLNLNLSYNHISEINSSLVRFTELTILDLSHNNLEILKVNNFKKLYNLQYLSLNSNSIKYAEKNVFDDMASLKSIDLQDNLIESIDQGMFINATALTAVRFARNKLKSLPKYAFKGKNIVVFSIEGNELQGSIEKGWFEGFLIQELNLGGQHLNSIENYAFTGLVSLQTLLLNNNNLNLLSNHSFKSLPNLKDLDLSYNDLINFDIVTDDLLRLEKLSLHHNKITQISSNNFKGLSTLQFLDLSHNNIAHFESKSFKSLEQLSSLKVSDNPLTGSIEEGTFDEIFYGVGDLRYLDLSYNKDLAFDVSFVEKAENLEKLYISGTKSDVSFEKIAEIPVTEVQIAHSYIRNVTQLNLKRFHRLETLVLSNNAVSKLEIGALSNLRALKNFDLSFNNLSSIQPGAFMNNTYLLYLNISHNNLIEINYGIFHGLIYLKTLDLSYNNIKSLHNGRLYDVENLERLIADYNKIDSISPYEFSGTSLATLSIGGNPLPCEVLVNLKKGSFEFTITAITSDKTNPNVGGVTCNKDSYVDRSKPKTSNESDNLLIDIRNILFNISQEHMVKESVTITHDAPYVANISEQQVKLNQNILDSVAKLSSVSNMTSTLINVNSDTNLLLGKILKVLSSKDSTAPQTVKSTFAVVKDNATSENLIPYINKIKEALEETIAVEKQNIMIDLDSKIEKINSRIGSSTLTTKMPVHDKLVN
ncbi:hypothetical protein MSG28_008454, partial [Choristoneura fumiferana]